MKRSPMIHRVLAFRRAKVHKLPGGQVNPAEMAGLEAVTSGKEREVAS